MDELFPTFFAFVSGFIEPLESRDSNIVRAAFCDCLAEIGDVVHQIFWASLIEILINFLQVLTKLPNEKRNLVISYLLRQCKDPDHRVVASAFRGIGMVVILKACQSDSLFLVKFILKNSFCSTVATNPDLLGRLCRYNNWGISFRQVWRSQKHSSEWNLVFNAKKCLPI